MNGTPIPISSDGSPCEYLGAKVVSTEVNGLMDAFSLFKEETTLITWPIHAVFVSEQNLL